MSTSAGALEPLLLASRPSSSSGLMPTPCTLAPKSRVSRTLERQTQPGHQTQVCSRLPLRHRRSSREDFARKGPMLEIAARQYAAVPQDLCNTCCTTSDNRYDVDCLIERWVGS